MGFPKQKYWNGLPFPSPEDLPNSRTEPASLCLWHWQAGSLLLVPHGKHTGSRTTNKLKKKKKKSQLPSFSAATNITFILYKN